MKLKTFLLVLFPCSAFCQNLSSDPQTSLISIKDSVELKNKSLQDVNEVISKWRGSLLDLDNLKTIYKLNISNQTEMVAVNLPVGTVLTQDKGNNKFLTNGSLNYSKTKTTGFNKFAPTATYGQVKFSFIYTVTSKCIVFEFTNLEYSHDMLHYGKFEDTKPPKDNTGGSLLFNMSKKDWEAVKQEYYDNLKILANNFKDFSTNLLQSNSSAQNQSQINYDTYKQIRTGMGLNAVVKLLGSEGKELSNNSTQVNGKNVVQQTIVWNDLDKSKSITVTFTNETVAGKSQTGL